MRLWAIMVTLEVVHVSNTKVKCSLLESSQMEAWAIMELPTSTPELVAIIGSGSKITSTQPQESQLKAVTQMTVVMEVVKMTSTNNV